VRNIQRVAAQTVAAVLSGRSLNHTLEVAWKRTQTLTRAERGAIQDLSYGTLRHLGRLRAVLSQLVPRQVENPELQMLLLVALYQLEYSEAAPYAVVDRAGAARLPIRSTQYPGDRQHASADDAEGQSAAWNAAGVLAWT